MDGLHALWTKLEANTTEATRLSWVSLGVFMVSFWVVNLGFTALDLLPSPFLDRFKIQKSKRLDMATLRKLVRQAVLNQVLIIVPFFLMMPFSVKQYGTIRASSPLPGWGEVGWQLVVSMLVEDTLFHWTHFLLHTPLLIPIHRLHHTMRQPSALASVYTHPVEYLINALCASAPVFLLRPHILTFWTWIVIRHFETSNAHSGYVFPFLPDARFHDYHHSHYQAAYGSFFKVWDRLLGLDKPVHAHIQSNAAKHE